jgi:hypothetical protein
VKEYSREKSILTRTLAHYQFKRDFTTVNDYYWGAGSALQAVAGRVRHMGSDDDFHAMLGLTQSKYVKPLGHVPDRYAEILNVSARWHRLLTVVIMTSAFERYLTAAATLAIASDPVLKPGFPKKIDGLVLAKYALQTGDRPTEQLTKGEWSARLAAFRKYFGKVPQGFKANEGTLEIMRNKRNQIAHEFGLDISSMSPHTAILLGARKPRSPRLRAVSIGEGTVKNWLGTLDSCATAIDEYLLEEFIGGYELAAIFIEWKRDPNALYEASGISKSSRGSVARQFSKVLGTLLEYPVQHETAQMIIDYVDGL